MQPFSQAPTPSRTVLFVLTSIDSFGAEERHTGFHFGEVTHPYRLLTDAGYAVRFASVIGGKAPMDSVDLSDPINKQFMDDAESVKAVENTLPLADIDPDHYAGVYFAGGHGAMWDFPGHARIERIVRNIYERGGMVSAIGHGVAALLDVQLSDHRYLVKRKRISGFTHAEETELGLNEAMPFPLQDRLTKAGAEFVSGPSFSACVTVEGQLITGQNPASAQGVGLAMVAFLERGARSPEAAPRQLEAI